MTCDTACNNTPLAIAGRRGDPLYRIRRVLRRSAENLTSAIASRALLRLASHRRSPRRVSGWSSASGLEQSEQLQVGDVFDDDRRRDLRDVVVGADFRFLHRSTESVGRRQAIRRSALRAVNDWNRATDELCSGNAHSIECWRCRSGRAHRPVSNRCNHSPKSSMRWIG